jgi:hypothetical protein
MRKRGSTPAIEAGSVSRRGSGWDQAKAGSLAEHACSEEVVGDDWQPPAGDTASRIATAGLHPVSGHRQRDQRDGLPMAAAPTLPDRQGLLLLVAASRGSALLGSPYRPGRLLPHRRLFPGGPVTSSRRKTIAPARLPQSGQGLSIFTYFRSCLLLHGCIPALGHKP